MLDMIGDKRKRAQILRSQTYEPNRLLDFVKSEIGIETDRKFSSILNVHPSMISKIRQKKTLMNADILLSIHELTGIPIKEIKRKMGQ